MGPRFALYSTFCRMFDRILYILMWGKQKPITFLIFNQYFAGYIWLLFVRFLEAIKREI